MMKSRRAVAPLLATLMLIIFAVGLGVLTMSVGGAYLEGSAAEVSGCAVLRVVSAPNPSNLEFTIPSVTINGDAGSVNRAAQCIVQGPLEVGAVSSISIS